MNPGRSSRLVDAIRNPQANIDILEITEIVSDWVWVTNDEHRFSYLSKQVVNHTTLHPEHFLGKTRSECGHPSALPKIRELDRIVETHVPFHDFELSWIGNDGKEKFVELSGKPFSDENGNFLGYIGSGRSTTERVKHERKLIELQNQLSQKAHEDHLTKLKNRHGLEQFITEFTSQEKSTPRGYSIILMDIDNFKEINDNYGHSHGDACLRRIAQTLVDRLPSHWCISRVGGDEFMIVAPDTLEDEAKKIAHDLVTFVASRVKLCASGHLPLSLSVGLATQYRSHSQPTQCMMDADLALSVGKRSAKGTVTIYRDRMRQDMQMQRQTRKELLAGLERGEIIPVYQPRIDLATQKIVGAEALARWQHPSGHLRAPASFMEIAKQANVLVKIDEAVFKQAVRDREEWSAALGHQLAVSVNVSPDRLANPKLLKQIADLSHARRYVSLELVETIWFDGMPDEIKQRIEAIKALGVDIELDDFGAGHASITGLLACGANKVKIDRRLLVGIEHNRERRKLFNSLVGMLRELDFVVIAEGVETNSQLTAALLAGCTEAQGYGIAPPLPHEEFLEFCRQHAASNALHLGAA